MEVRLPRGAPALPTLGFHLQPRCQNQRGEGEKETGSWPREAEEAGTTSGCRALGTQERCSESNSPSDPPSPAGGTAPGLPAPPYLRRPSRVLLWEDTLFLPEATGGHGSGRSRSGSASQVVPASRFHDPTRICVSGSVGLHGGPWSALQVQDPHHRPPPPWSHGTAQGQTYLLFGKNGTNSLCLPGVPLNHRATLIPIKSFSVPGPVVLAPQEMWPPGESTRCCLAWGRRRSELTEPHHPAGRLLWQMEGCCLWGRSPSVGCWE